MKFHLPLKTVVLVTGIGLMQLPCNAAAGPPMTEPTQLEQATTAPDRQTDGKAVEPAAPVYKPPRRGAPEARVGGGTRGPGDTTPYITVIAPPQVALTASSQPMLYWYVSERMQGRLELTLINDRDIEPVLELELGNDMPPGIHAFDLSRHNINLETGKSYQWSVAAIVDPQHRSSDILSSSRLEYSVPDPAIAEQVRNTTPEQAVQLYAAAGYWYDAYAILTALVADNPGNTGFIRQRIALLEQAGLPVVSDYAQQQSTAITGE